MARGQFVKRAAQGQCVLAGGQQRVAGFAQAKGVLGQGELFGRKRRLNLWQGLTRCQTGGVVFGGQKSRDKQAVISPPALTQGVCGVFQRSLQGPATQVGFGQRGQDGGVVGKAFFTLGDRKSLVGGVAVKVSLQPVPQGALGEGFQRAAQQGVAPVFGGVFFFGQQIIQRWCVGKLGGAEKPAVAQVKTHRKPILRLLKPEKRRVAVGLVQACVQLFGDVAGFFNQSRCVGAP